MTATVKGGSPLEIPTENPVAVRRPLRLQVQEIGASEPQNSATHRIADNQILFCTRLDVMDENLVSLGASTIRGFARLDAKLDALAGLSPMRRREDSSHALEEMAREVGEGARHKAQQIVDDPNAELTPDVVRDMMKAEVESALKKQRETDRVRKLEADAAEIERKHNEADATAKERAREKREFRRLTGAAVVSGLVVLVATTLVAFGQGRATEHDKAYAEARAAVVPLPIPVPSPAAFATVMPPEPSGVPIRAPAPAAPAAVAPTRR